MDVDKAYILGLVIGGGIFNENSFKIRLPYKQWGSIDQNPSRAGKIGRDILHVVKPIFKNTYNLDVTYIPSEREWDIICDGDLTALKKDLKSYNINPAGELRKSVSIRKIVAELIDDNMKRRFIAGLADTIGSTSKSHRRFTNNIQIISFEISGFDFHFVCDLCQLLHSIQCYPDQILWNHPNFHSGNDPYYESWKKGFKLRVELDQYEKFGAFAFQTKAESAKENMGLQNQKNIALPCYQKKMVVSKTCVHIDENDTRLPENIRGGHYIHNKHVCAVLGCQYAPYNQVIEFLQNAGEYINPFPVISKGKNEEIRMIIENNPLFATRVYSIQKIDVKLLYSMYKVNKNQLLYSQNSYSGYPISQLLKGIAFLIAASTNQLNGYRIKGSFEKIIQTFDDSLEIEMHLPEILTPLILTGGEYSVIIGPENPKIYNKLIVPDPENPYKISIRPIREKDLIVEK